MFKNSTRMSYSRKDFIRIAGLAVASAAMLPAVTAQAKGKKPEKSNFKLGIASYTFRKFSLEETIKMVTQMNVPYIALKSMHMPLDASASDIKNMAQKVRSAGLKLYGAGVIYMKNQMEIDQAFEYSKIAGLDVIIGVPNPELLPYVNRKVKEYNIKVAIHNHGPGDEMYPSPTTIYERIKDLDPRIGICIDIGHTVRINEDPAKLAQKYANRLHDVHIKDVTGNNKEGRTLEIGRGVIDIPAFLRTLKKINYSGVVALEYEKDESAPLAGSAESIGYVRGVLSVI
jgi:inosose dehydratase